jgi:hypothetical protein
MPENWSRQEVEAVVADYFHMLTQELAGQSYNKTAHRKALAAKLDDRTNGSIERKHQNISAVLRELGCHWIPGYKPLGNYQRLLVDVVIERLKGDRLFDKAAAIAAEQPATMPLDVDFARVLETAPVASVVQEPDPAAFAGRSGVQRNYVALEARNRSLGLAGEEFVLAFERHRLHVAGKKRLSDRVEHVSVTKGDGLGYDVLSFEADGRERFIEVKTTAFAKETPFFISRSEVEFSSATADRFHLFRVFEFRRRPRMFDLAGDVRDRCRLDPATFIARF